MLVGSFRPDVFRVVAINVSGKCAAHCRIESSDDITARWVPEDPCWQRFLVHNQLAGRLRRKGYRR